MRNVCKGLVLLMSLACLAFLGGCGESGESAKTPVDLDLTSLSETMAYSQAQQILMDPSKYDGLTCRLAGIYNSFRDFDTEELYFVCGVPDVTGCCNATVEIALDDSYAYPEDYPEEFDEITVMGTISSYDNGGYEGCIVKGAVLEEDM